MSVADQIINSPDYIDNIFNEIYRRWPTLYEHVVKTTRVESGAFRYRTKLCNVIGYEGVKTYDGIIKHIIKNEDKLDWWIL